MTLFASGLPSITATSGVLPIRTAWLNAGDIPDTVEGLFEELAIAKRAARWQPVSILDVAELLPEPEIDPDQLIRLWPEPPWWHAQALCAVADPKKTIDPNWFGVEGEDNRPALPEVNVRKAREVCEVCPVAPHCLQWAMEWDERFGVWAGTTGRQRTQLRKALREGDVTMGELLSVFT